ncbi:MAG: hypothetical protein WAK28_15445, partial [Trebonia sp.]
MAGLANLAVRAGSGCPREGVQEGQEVDPAQPPVQVGNAAEADVLGLTARRRPAAMTGLDVIAAGISLSVSGLWHRLCSVAW